MTFTAVTNVARDFAASVVYDAPIKKDAKGAGVVPSGKLGLKPVAVGTVFAALGATVAIAWNMYGSKVPYASMVQWATLPAVAVIEGYVKPPEADKMDAYLKGRTFQYGKPMLSGFAKVMLFLGVQKGLGLFNVQGLNMFKDWKVALATLGGIAMGLKTVAYPGYTLLHAPTAA